MAVNIAMEVLGAVLHEIRYWKLRSSRMKMDSEISEALEARIAKSFKDTIEKMERMNRDVKKFQESTQSELNRIRADMEKEGKKELENARALESMIKMLLENNDTKISTLEQELQKSQESTKSELQLIRRYVEAALGKKEVENARAVESETEKLIQQLCKRIENLEQDLLERRESPKQKKEVENARVMESRMEKSVQQLSERMENLEQDLQKSKESTQLQLQVLSKDLENKLEKKGEEILMAMESKMDEKFDQFFKRMENRDGDFQKSRVYAVSASAPENRPVE